ncbi:MULTISPECIES: 3-hydroxyacyl-ACP dehydratase FabZ [Desulfococcus]|jgi:beta-hydroxyacyl-ACP dehydratase FabZ|uniref:3-hydroxyacyl-[acyl-carrier-protein] dehydratase FabZ n=1 Tax=Desulfococcus multivorans DSM 2059 TaxID=1121405 RepID=S7TDR2_DESML|nr:3-hydroxyacyl-ACP dehydratase FabZ [Desulfococcus multivorans]AQV00961.1 beta-hydroxyacyl-ACP dehydratase [Desulfococcus multivorans]EPR35327.1 (3R)-hydroxymyristoyl-(acyl-carrier-protein) dehydratase [Desulfococcus multivorans DSM 2059]MDX9819401.1 3-hydroxyacyl-ACP dehydratase FabZ [Desulfococcus multivorans]SJZ46068.1 3-hydroxyacyl-[acyl-carrier-protein] dehydratase [Desulfococcus multivorans DSM 2059]
MDSVYSVTDIMKFLPHRYPFILVDRILELEPGKRVKALKNVTINEPFFQGHFPRNPIMPGVLILEAMAQAGGVLVIESLPPEKHGSLVYFMGIDKARFRQPVVPGDQLIFDIEIIKSRGRAAKLAGVASVDGKRVAEAEVMATIGEQS